VVSNGDSDHAGGVEVITSALPVDDLLSGEPDRVQGARLCRAGEAWSWDGVEFRVLHPPGARRLREPNDNSCVVRVSNGEWSLLLPGDIEAEGERSLLASQVDGLPSDILVAPHHGSASSSTEAFIAEVNPEWVLFSAGYRNRYGFPKAVVVDRWRQAGARTINSAEAGAVSFYLNSDASPPLVVLERDRGRRYWNR
jgi:competence protein ComEC